MRAARTRAKVACRGLGGRTLRSNARRDSDSEDLKENVSCGYGSNRISGDQSRSHRNGDREQSTNRHGSCRRVDSRLRRNSRLRCGLGRNDAAWFRGATRSGQRGFARSARMYPYPSQGSPTCPASTHRLRAGSNLPRGDLPRKSFACRSWSPRQVERREAPQAPEQRIAATFS